VIRVVNADGQQIADSISYFEGTLSVVGGVGIFYYAGRAAYIDGEDVLMPVDVKLDSTQTILEGGVNLATLQAQIQAKTTRAMDWPLFTPRQKAKKLTMAPQESTLLSQRHSWKPSRTTTMNSVISFDASVEPWMESRVIPSKSRRPISGIRVRSDSTSTDPKLMLRSARSKFLSSIRVATIL
jgi:hypothetical protein